MRKYLVRRFLNMIPTLLLVSLGVFALDVHFVNPVPVCFGCDNG